MKKIVLSLMLCLCLCVVGCGGTGAANSQQGEDTRIFIDGADREVEIPKKIERTICVDVGALRYTCYMDAQDLVVGVEDYETEQSIYRLYNYVNFEKFKDLPIIGNNGEQYIEEISVEGRKRTYQITEKGLEMLKKEYERLLLQVEEGRAYLN